MSPTTFSDAPTEQAAPSTEAHTEEDADARPPTDRVVTVHHVGRLAVLALPLGVLVAVLTTSDPLWWQLHFSQLGTFADFSARTFNSTVIFSGFFLAAYGVFLRLALPTGTGRRVSRALRGAIVSAGLHLTVIGVIPIPVSPVLHDIAASGLGLSFLATVIGGLGLPGRSRRFRRATTFCVGLLAIGMVALTAGFITLASFEFVAFVSMGVWLLCLPRALAYRGHGAAASPTSPPLAAGASNGASGRGAPAAHVVPPRRRTRRAGRTAGRALGGERALAARRTPIRPAIPGAVTATGARSTVRTAARWAAAPHPWRTATRVRSDREAVSSVPPTSREGTRPEQPARSSSPARRTRSSLRSRTAPPRAPATHRPHRPHLPSRRGVGGTRPARMMPARRIRP